jgi:hypothetical protein
LRLPTAFTSKRIGEYTEERFVKSALPPQKKRESKSAIMTDCDKKSPAHGGGFFWMETLLNSVITHMINETEFSHWECFASLKKLYPFIKRLKQNKRQLFLEKGGEIC